MENVFSIVLRYFYFILLNQFGRYNNITFYDLHVYSSIILISNIIYTEFYFYYILYYTLYHQGIKVLNIEIPLFIVHEHITFLGYV